MRSNADKIALILPVALPGDEVKVILPAGDHRFRVLIVGPDQPRSDVSTAVALIDRAYRIMQQPRSTNDPGIIRETVSSRAMRYWGSWPNSSFAVCQWSFPQPASRPRVAIALLHRATLTQGTVQRTSELLADCLDYAGLATAPRDILVDLNRLIEDRKTKQKGEVHE